MTTSSVLLSPQTPDYPERLRALGFARPVYVRGTLSAGRAVAIVGARAASRLGMDRAHAAARHLAERGVHVVSGGALGIDGAAHRGAVAGARASTTVVLGTGADVAYPARHAGLFDQILASGGALASLLPDGSGPRPGTFPQRNPLIAALADVVVVVEAELKSGSLSTARAARGFGKPVVAYPGSPGCDRLLASGAAIAVGPDDVLAALEGTPRMPRVLAPELQRIREAAASGARGVDAIAAATGLPVRAVLRALPLIERYS
ncbi:MAG TPA: DNA-processing protein DprA [Kofleriaceae bacterium]